MTGDQSAFPSLQRVNVVKEEGAIRGEDNEVRGGVDAAIQCQKSIAMHF